MAEKLVFVAPYQYFLGLHCAYPLLLMNAVVPATHKLSSYSPIVVKYVKHQILLLATPPTHTINKRGALFTEYENERTNKPDDNIQPNNFMPKTLSYSAKALHRHTGVSVVCLRSFTIRELIFYYYSHVRCYTFCYTIFFFSPFVRLYRCECVTCVVWRHNRAPSINKTAITFIGHNITEHDDNESDNATHTLMHIFANAAIIRHSSAQLKFTTEKEKENEKGKNHWTNKWAVSFCISKNERASKQIEARWQNEKTEKVYCIIYD